MYRRDFTVFLAENSAKTFSQVSQLLFATLKQPSGKRDCSLVVFN